MKEVEAKKLFKENNLQTTEQLLEGVVLEGHKELYETIYKIEPHHILLILEGYGKRVSKIYKTKDYKEFIDYYFTGENGNVYDKIIEKIDETTFVYVLIAKEDVINKMKVER